METSHEATFVSADYVLTALSELVGFFRKAHRTLSGSEVPLEKSLRVDTSTEPALGEAERGSLLLFASLRSAAHLYLAAPRRLGRPLADSLARLASSPSVRDDTHLFASLRTTQTP